MIHVSPKFLECAVSVLVSSSQCTNCCFLQKRRNGRVCRGPADRSPPRRSSTWGSPGPQGPAEAHVLHLAADLGIALGRAGDFVSSLKLSFCVLGALGAEGAVRAELPECGAPSTRSPRLTSEAQSNT